MSAGRSDFRFSPLRVALALGATVLFSACPVESPRVPEPSSAEIGRATPTLTRMPRKPTATPTVPFEESAIGEMPALTPAPGMEQPSATAVPTPPTAGVVASASEPESLLKRIGPGTPPNVAAALRLIEDGRQQMDQGAYDAALDRLERAVAIDPTNGYGYYFLAKVHFLKNDYDQAIAFASRAASLSARTDNVSLGRIHSLQGAVFEQVGRYSDARKAYQQAVEADPNNLAARVGVTRLSAGEINAHPGD